MPDFPNFADLFRIARDESLTRSAALKRNVIEREGTDANALTAGGVAVGDECIGQLTKVSAGLFLDSSSSTQVDRILWDRYQILRKGASPAFGEVQFSLPSPAAGSFTIPANTQLQTSDGKVFLTIGNTVFSSGSSGPVTVSVQSLQSGLSQQAQIGTITSIQGTIPGAPAGLTVNNPLATAGASDEESTDAFKQRGKTYYVTARRGTLRAIEQGATSVPGITSATAFETTDPNGYLVRVVELVVSDTYTDQLVNAGSLPPTYQTQSSAITSQILSTLLEFRAAGIQVFVTLGSVVLQPILLALRFQAGVNTDAVALAARNAVIAYVNSLRPGATLTVSGMEAALQAVPGLIVTPGGSNIISPAGDVVPQTLQVLRTSLALCLVGVSS